MPRGDRGPLHRHLNDDAENSLCIGLLRLQTALPKEGPSLKVIARLESFCRRDFAPDRLRAQVVGCGARAARRDEMFGGSLMIISGRPVAQSRAAEDQGP